MLGHKSAALTLDRYADLFPTTSGPVLDALEAAVLALKNCLETAQCAHAFRRIDALLSINLIR